MFPLRSVISSCVFAVPVHSWWASEMASFGSTKWWPVCWERHHAEAIQQIPTHHRSIWTGHRVYHERVQGSQDHQDKVIQSVRPTFSKKRPLEGLKKCGLLTHAPLTMLWLIVDRLMVIMDVAKSVAESAQLSKVWRYSDQWMSQWMSQLCPHYSLLENAFGNNLKEFSTIW